MAGGTSLPSPLVLDLGSVPVTDYQLVQLCADNGDLRIELPTDKELPIMPPAFPISGMRNNAISARVYTWTKEAGTGISYNSSAGFTFPNGTMRSPDSFWIDRERWESLVEHELSRFSRIAPDSLVELRSRSDNLSTLLSKMDEYLENGVRLGWLIDPFQQQVHLYRPGQPSEIIENSETVSGDPVPPGFTLDLKEIW